MCVCIYFCHASWPNKKRNRPEIRYTYSHSPYLKTGFLFFAKKGPWGPLVSKNCRITWIFRMSPRCSSLVFLSLFKFCQIKFIMKCKNLGKIPPRLYRIYSKYESLIFTWLWNQLTPLLIWHWSAPSLLAAPISMI